MEVEIMLATKPESAEIEKLSQKFADEKCCNNIIADTKEFFAERNVFVAICKNQIVGYCYGDIGEEKNKRSFAEAGDKYYELEEIYVLPEFRSNKIGKKLYDVCEAYALKEGCKTIRLNAVSKNYQQLLKFYIDDLGMDFISAFLVKKIK